MCAWFLKIAFVHDICMHMCVHACICACVCLLPRLLLASGVMWCDIEPICGLVKQALQLCLIHFFHGLFVFLEAYTPVINKGYH